MRATYFQESQTSGCKLKRAMKVYASWSTQTTSVNTSISLVAVPPLQLVYPIHNIITTTFTRVARGGKDSCKLSQYAVRPMIMGLRAHCRNTYTQNSKLTEKERGNARHVNKTSTPALRCSAHLEAPEMPSYYTRSRELGCCQEKHPPGMLPCCL